jgi:FAD/FMN-containing dehydrogenase
MVTANDLVKIVGVDNVLTDPALLAECKEVAGLPEGHAAEFIVKPRDIKDIQAVIELANQKGFHLIPRSSTGFRLRGSTIPLSPESIIVDLSGMDSIIRIDKRNKVAMIEPGVTFSKLIREVEKEGLRLEAPMLPRKGKSVVASILEREPTTGPKYNWDANDPLCCMELVFGNGDLFRTGNAAGPGSLEEQWASGQAQKVPMGPAQTDLGRLIQGAQGSLGIVSWATIKLEIKPSNIKGFVVGSENFDELIDFSYKLLWRKLPDLCLILNDVNLSAISGIEKEKLSPWNLVYSISGLKYFPEERINYIERDIADIARKSTFTPARSLAGMSADDLVQMLVQPSDEPFWKFGARGGTRDLFFLTTLDRTGEFIEAVENIADGSVTPGVYIQPVRHGTGCHLEFNFFHNPEDKAETEAVDSITRESAEVCLGKDAFFSRPYGEWAELAYSRCPDTVGVLCKLKDIFDPAGVMNPGRLCFGKEA